MKQTVFFLAILAVCVSACSKKVPDSSTSERPNLVSVTTIQVHSESLVDTLHVLGELHAQEHISIFPKVKGKLVSYAVKKGESVQKGDLIAYIDRDEVGYTYNQAPVYSPLSGIISELPFDEGSEVTSNTVIGQIMNIEAVKGVFSVPDRYFGHIQFGQPMDISVNGTSYTAVIYEISPLIDPATRSFCIKARINNSGNALLPGMFSTGEIALKTIPDSILVPEESVVSVGGHWHIFKVVDDKAVLEEVTLGLRKHGRIHITAGIQEGEQIIVRGQHKVIDGQDVRSSSL